MGFAKGGCCQLGLICPCPCGPCKEVTFDVTDYHSGNGIGRLTKIVPDCLKFLVADDVSNYKVEFGAVQNPQWKAMSLHWDFSSTSGISMNAVTRMRTCWVQVMIRAVGWSQAPSVELLSVACSEERSEEGVTTVS